jgi:DNA-binding CsgD family transcriptional regulator
LTEAVSDPIERAGELAAVDAALEAARAGRGGVLLVEGPPGIGKTELLTAAVARARRRGMLVLSAAGAELESSLPYSVVRQLFERTVAEAEPAVRDGLLRGAAVHAQTVVDPRAEARTAPADPAAVLHGLYWLTANLVAERPAALVVDDLHWGDPASAGWLSYLARRVEGLAVAVILGAREVEPGADDALLAGLRATEGVRRVSPAPLSPAAVEGLTRALLGPQAERAFSEACHAATGGNPFYVTELLRALGADRVAGTVASAAAIEGLTPRAVVDATLARLGRMPGEAREVAAAVALLEPRAELRLAAELAELDLDVVASAADSLLEVGLLGSVAPCRFEHPILRSAVASEIAPARRALLHRRAAGVLAGARLPVAAVAAQLMQTQPLGETWIVSTLVRAAEQASARGAPAAAISYLERALAERPAPQKRRELLLELGRAEAQLGRPGASSHLREALALAESADEAAVTALALCSALGQEGAIDEAYEVASEVARRSEGQGTEPMLELQSWLLIFAPMAGRTAETADLLAALEQRAPHGSAAAGAVQVSLALRGLTTGDSPGRVCERAERAVAELAQAHGSGSAALEREAPGAAFLWADELDRAHELFTEAIEAAQRLGRRRSFEHFSALRGFTVHRRGDLADAAADVEPMLTAAAQGEAPGASMLFALATQVLLLVDQGRPDAAEALASSAAIPAAFERMPIVALLRHAQGLAQLAQRRFDEAAATLTGVGEAFDADGMLTPAILPWRSALALALAGTDRHEEGLELARAELSLAERGEIDRARGLALRSLGLLEGGDEGLAALEAAVAAFEQSPARLEHGWACFELGAALRRSNRRRDARAPLDRALDRALACGARALADRAAEELGALGARSRSVPLTGAQSLTPSERRVCRLAADGLTNGEIAQALFVTTRTVETHLGHSYRKLDIASRAELPRTLGAARPENAF